MQRQSAASQQTSRVGWLTFLGFLAFFGSLAWDVNHQISKERSGAFATYFEAASAMRAGGDPYANHHVYRYVYPPLYAWLYQPLTHLTESAAARVMLGIDCIFFLAALLLGATTMLKRFGRPSNAASAALVAILAALIAVVPIHNELRGLETNSMLLLSFVLALYWLDRHPLLAGLALAIAINVKYLPILALPYLLLRRRWLASAATVVGTIAVGMLPALTIGWHTNLRYVRVAIGGLMHLAGDQSIADAAQVRLTDDVQSLSITSTLTRLASTHDWPRPAAVLILFGVICIWTGGIMLMSERRGLPVGLWPSKTDQFRPPFPALLGIEWAALVTFCLAFSPNSQNRNLVLAVVPALLAAMLIWFPRRFTTFAMAALVTLMMIAALSLPIAAMGKPFTVQWFANGWPCWILLAAFLLLARAAKGSILRAEVERLAAENIYTDRELVHT